MPYPFASRRSFICTGLAVGAALLAACSEKKQVFNSIDISGSEMGQDFAISDHNGQLRKLADFTGKVVIVFFGYTQCPDVCPTTMAELVEVKRLLGKDGERLQPVFITVDPERDTPALLKAYMANFDPTFLALCPTPAQLAEVAASFKVYYKKVPGSTATSYTMDHLAGFYIYDTQGRLRLFSRPNMSTADLQSDVASLLEGR
jgi:protein SCO1/2